VNTCYARGFMVPPINVFLNRTPKSTHHPPHWVHAESVWRWHTVELGSAMGAIYNVEAGNLLVDENERKLNTCIVEYLASYVCVHMYLHRASIRYTSIKETN
jgi:hypothetical protein